MNNLQKLREDRDIKQIEVANYLGVVHQTYSKIEKNIESAKAQTLKKIAEFFNVSIDYLLGLIDDPLPLHRSKITPPPSDGNSITLKTSDREALERTANLINEILKK